MIPTTAQLCQSTINGLNSASGVDAFGRNLLLSGKSPRFSRENWVRDFIAEDLRAKGFAVVVERERIDISVWDTYGNRPLVIVEAKFLYTHGPRYFCNIWYDFLKRYHYGVPQYTIVLVGDYLEMPAHGDLRKLYDGASIRKRINREKIRFDLFCAEIVKDFSPHCQIFFNSSAWRAEHAGALMSLHSLVLLLNNGVSQDELIARFKGSTSSTDFNKRISKLHL